jgi:hypothetical protein
VACKKTHIRVELQENNGLAGEGHYVIPWVIYVVY